MNWPPECDGAATLAGAAALDNTGNDGNEKSTSERGGAQVTGGSAGGIDWHRRLAAESQLREAAAILVAEPHPIPANIAVSSDGRLLARGTPITDIELGWAIDLLIRWLLQERRRAARRPRVAPAVRPRLQLVSGGRR